MHQIEVSKLGVFQKKIQTFCSEKAVRILHCIKKKGVSIIFCVELLTSQPNLITQKNAPKKKWGRG
jgi:hypothetical protein